MPERVDFYVVADAAPDAPERFACRLAEKAWRRGHRVYLHVADEAAARRLDELLWTFRQDSFVPHALAGPGIDAPEPVLIGAAAPEGELDVAINLTDEVPAWVDRTRRLAELVPAQETGRAAGRRRYREYIARGYPVDHHTV